MNDLEQIESSVNGLIFSDISDHLPIFHVASLPTNQNCHKTENTLYKRIYCCAKFQEIWSSVSPSKRLANLYFSK